MTVCFIGHRKIADKVSLTNKINEMLLTLIERGADTFLFGNKSEFDSICWECVTELKSKYPSIKRVYVRSSYPEISLSYKVYLLHSYEETYFPQKIVNAGRCAYVERNFEMIDKSEICVFYYDTNYIPPSKSEMSSYVVEHKANSGTKIAYHYALSKKKQVINLCA